MYYYYVFKDTPQFMDRRLPLRLCASAAVTSFLVLLLLHHRGHRFSPPSVSSPENCRHAPEDSPPSAAEVAQPYLVMLVRALLLVPVSHYCLAVCVAVAAYLYASLEFHILGDVCSGFRGERVSLTFHPGSHLRNSVVSKCRVLRGRYLSTPWLCSPHLQTAFLFIFGKSYPVKYKRELFHTPDEETIALDWLRSSDVRDSTSLMNDTIHKDAKTPIVVVIPGFLSDSTARYIKRIAFNMARLGWDVCVSNHRGLGGTSIISNCFYNCGWTEDTRKVIDYIHCQYPEAPLYAIGTSIGANILVKYLGEDGTNVPIAGAVAICSPWDLLLFDRFMKRKFVQKLYDKALTAAIKGYAEMHRAVFSRTADWEETKKSCTFREFDHFATRLLGKFKTVDMYYRQSSSVNVVGNVAVPLLCINALDDPICPREAIPWDECRENKNIILATTQHGGHIAHFEGATANSMWWLRAVREFLSVLHSSQITSSKR